MNFLIYDVETAQQNQASICQVGWIALHNDTIVDEGSTLIDPECAFSSKNTAIHGISAKDCVGAPRFADYFNSVLAPHFDADVILAHNASFDLTATAASLIYEGVTPPSVIYVDTLELFRSAVSIEAYKLSELAEAIGFTYTAHDAHEDCRALLAVLNYVREQTIYDDIASLIVHAHVPFKLFEYNSAKYKPPKASSGSSRNMVSAEGCLSGQRFCLTGDCDRPRAEVMALIAQNGGVCTSGVSGKTNYLVVGEYEDYGPDYVSGKHRKALELIDEGADISIISYDELFAMIE